LKKNRNKRIDRAFKRTHNSRRLKNKKGDKQMSYKYYKTLGNIETETEYNNRKRLIKIIKLQKLDRELKTLEKKYIEKTITMLDYDIKYDIILDQIHFLNK